MSRALEALNTQIAQQIMGWSNVRFNDRGDFFAVTPESAPQRTRLPLFTEDLNACRVAEMRVIDAGHFQTYHEVLPEVMGPGADPAMALCAPPEARCAALIQTLERLNVSVIHGEEASAT